jgi:hypothetical protein
MLGQGNNCRKHGQITRSREASRAPRINEEPRENIEEAIHGAIPESSQALINGNSAVNNMSLIPGMSRLDHPPPSHQDPDDHALIEMQQIGSRACELGLVERQPRVMTFIL